MCATVVKLFKYLGSTIFNWWGGVMIEIPYVL
jgi:hypothetical protein